MTQGASAPRDRELGEYALLAKLATGGMAEIFLASNAGAERTRALTIDDVVVVKRILPHLADDEHFVTMFRDEANLAALLVHENVCRVHRLGHAGGVWFIVMEYLHGVALSRMLSRLSKQRQFLDVRAVAGLIVQACAGLHHAHEARGPDGQHLGVVHRDVSPPNILITAGGVVKLLDFGIAKARGASSKTRTGTVKGKNAYMSPEQILGKPLDRRSDVFALGAVMFELLAVKRLFHRDSDFLTFKAITEEPIPDIRERRPDLPPAMVAVLTRALAREPGGRFATAAAMGAAVQEAIAPLGGAASASELALIVGRDFADELATKEDVLAQARRAAAVSADARDLPSVSSASSSSGNLAVAATQVDAGSRSGPVVAPTEDIEALEAIDGELLVPEPDDELDRHARPASTMEIGDFAGTPPPTPPTRRLAQPPPTPAIASRALSEAPTSVQMLDLADPSTDLLGPWRKRNMRLAIGLSAAAVVAIVVAIVLTTGGGSRPAAGTAVPIDAAPVATVEIDAAPPPIDGGPSREDIIALSRYGFLSVAADDKTVVYLDGVRVGEAPLLRMPLKPGPYKLKAVGPRGKSRKFDIVVEATKDVDLGTIEWSAN